jgi:hypothetical protein
VTTAEIILSITAVVFALLSQHYKAQRDDLAAFVIYLHPDDFKELADEAFADESSGSGSDSDS